MRVCRHCQQEAGLMGGFCTRAGLVGPHEFVDVPGREGPDFDELCPIPRVCWFSRYRDAGPCDGRLIKGHLIPKQRIKREVGKHAMWDDRTWVWLCGGPTGIGGHHGMLDGRQYRPARVDLPPEVEEFAREHGLEWSLERDFGPAI